MACFDGELFTILPKSPSWEFPTSDHSQNEAWYHAKKTDVKTPIEDTGQRSNQHCKFNVLVVRIDDYSIVFNCTRCKQGAIILCLTAHLER